VLRGDLDLLAAGVARDLVVEPEQVVAQFRELGPVTVVGSGRRPVLLRTLDPSNAEFAGPPARGTLVSGLRVSGFSVKNARSSTIPSCWQGTVPSSRS
jgi:hypothetical protein